MSPLTRRATIEFRQANADHIEGGVRWYPSAHEIARDQAAEHHVTIETAAGVISALSPRLSWGKNIVLAERMLASGGTLSAGCITRSLDHARAIYDGAAPLDVLRGPKTRAFYAAILTAGESPDPVIDRHAWDMLTGTRGAPPPNLGQYRAAAHCMSRASIILGQPVSVVQAATWLSWRARFWKEGALDLAA